MIAQPQQIALDLNLDPGDRPPLEPPLEPARVRKLIALMADAIVALIEATGRKDDD